MPITILWGTILRSQSKLVGMYIGARSQQSSFIADKLGANELISDFDPLGPIVLLHTEFFWDYGQTWYW